MLDGGCALPTTLAEAQQGRSHFFLLTYKGRQWETTTVQEGVFGCCTVLFEKQLCPGLSSPPFRLVYVGTGADPHLIYLEAEAWGG